MHMVAAGRLAAVLQRAAALLWQRAVMREEVSTEKRDMHVKLERTVYQLAMPLVWTRTAVSWDGRQCPVAPLAVAALFYRGWFYCNSVAALAAVTDKILN